MNFTVGKLYLNFKKMRIRGKIYFKTHTQSTFSLSSDSVNTGLDGLRSRRKKKKFSALWLKLIGGKFLFFYV